MRALASAFAYFTILPVPGIGHRDRLDARALSWLPLVGAAVGALAGLLGWFVTWRLPGFGGVAAWIAAILLTGAIHVDGFLDCCDGVFVTATPERRLEILRDPHHGSFAIAGMAMASLLWVKAIDAIPGYELPAALAFTGCVARLAALANAWVFPYESSGTMTQAFVARPPIVPVLLAVAVAALLGWRIGPATIALIPIAILAGVLLGFFASRRLGGRVTGDVYGAIVVVIEILLLLRLAEFAQLIAT